jgi:hypothetical protein
LCGHREVKTLDHYLARKYHPALSIVPANLVPACTECNFSKGQSRARVAGRQTFHPYFDNVEADRWLFANVQIAGGVSLDFFVQPPPPWTLILAARARRHFKLFQLNTLYATQAAQELVNIKGELRSIFDSGGMLEVQYDLQRRAQSCRAAHINSWQTAMYEALSLHDNFCDGGFENIAL